MLPFTLAVYGHQEYLTNICILFQLTGKLRYFFIISFYGPRTLLFLKDVQASLDQTSSGDLTRNETSLFLLSFMNGCPYAQ